MSKGIVVGIQIAVAVLGALAGASALFTELFGTGLAQKIVAVISLLLIVASAISAQIPQGAVKMVGRMVSRK